MKLKRHPIQSGRWPRAALLALLVAALPAPALAQREEANKAARHYEDALQRYEKSDMPGAIIQLKNALQIDKSLLPVHALLGKALLANGDVVAAEVAFDEALRLGVNRGEVVIPLARAALAQGKARALLDQPRFADTGLPAGTQAQLLLLKASAAGDVGDPRAALKFIEGARTIDPGRPDTWLAEVPIRLRARQVREAMAAADKAIAMTPGTAEALYLRGTIAHGMSDLPVALTYYDKALKSHPTHTEALVSRAGLLLDMGRWSDAASDVAVLRKSSAVDPRGAYLAALLAERDGNTAAAKAALNEVTALLDPVPMEFIRYRPQLLILGGQAHFGLNQREKAIAYLEAAQRSQPNSAVSKLLAQIYLSDGKIDRAAEALESYLKGRPNDPQAMLLLASAHMTQGRHARATRLMQDALTRQDLPALRGMLGIGLVGAGKYTQAVTEFETVLRKDPGNVQAGSALASIYLHGGQPAKAVQVAEDLAKRRPNHAGLQNLLGSARAAVGDANGARAAFEQALKLDPLFLAPQVNLARLDTERGAYDNAAVRLNAVLGKNEKDVDALMEMARVQARRGQREEAQRWLEKADEHSGPDNLQPGFALVDFHLGQRRPDLALKAVRRVTDKAPDAVPVLMALARVRLANSDTTGARTALTRASNNASNDAPALVRIAMLQRQAGDLPGATYSLEKALGGRPDYLAAHALLAEVEIRQGDLAKAEQRAQRILAVDPKRGTGHALLGDVAWLRKQPPLAIESYRRAHQLDQSTDSLLRLFRAIAASDSSAALQLAEQWLKSHPNDLAVRRAAADGYARAGNLAAARSAYELVLKATPNDAEALNNLANVLVLSKDPDALKVAERALASEPAAPNIIGTVGWAAFKAGQHDRALQLLRDARLRDPANPETRYFLGAVLASKGRNAEAREELEAALRGNAAFGSANDARQLLQTLR